MRTSFLLGLIVLQTTGSGCATAPSIAEENPAALHGAMLAAYKSEAVETAVIRQRTIYSYQFTTETAELNELGWRDINILANHFRKHSGTLNVQRGDVSTKLYQARGESVLAALRQAGVASDRVSLADGLPGGDGIASWRVLIIQEEMSDPAPAADSTSTSTIPGLPLRQRMRGSE